MLSCSSYLLCASAMLFTTPDPAPAAPRDRMLVSPAWVHARLDDGDLVLLHLGDRREYEKAHLPGARLLEYRVFSHRPANGLSLELPPIERLDSAFAALGVTERSRIVLYFGSDWVSPTTRAWLTLEFMGLGNRTVIMDGGMPAWQAAGYAVTADAPPAVTPRPLRTSPHPDIVTDAEHIASRQGDTRFRLVDARDRTYYLGLDAGSGRTAGRVPGARSLPYTSVTDSLGRFLPDTALVRLFAAAGVKQGDDVVAYCHIGQQATAVVFAARLIGIRARLYDGSWQDWSSVASRPVLAEVPPTKGGLMSTGELAERLGQHDVTLVDLRSDLAAYLADHLPDAIYLHYENLRATGSGVPGDVLAARSYADLWGRLGLRKDRPVVVYGSGDAQNFNATFLAWILAGFRHPEVYVLDGGYAKWKAEGRTLDRSYPEIASVTYDAEPYLLERIEGVHVQHGLGEQGVAIVDVRPPDQYAGAAGAQVRRGRIPGAVNRFWHDDLATAGGSTTWKSPEALRAEYAALGITPDKTIIVYCNTGTEASHVYFTLRHLLGYPNVLVYAPSWTEWAAKADWPIEQGAPAGTPPPAAAAGGRGCGSD